jgi:tRNA-specific 2-thiouridylase
MRVPYHIVDAQAQFRREVMDYFVGELRAGRTPNPCAMCNPNMKFKMLLDYARKKGIGHVATGHYARVKADKRGNAHLLRAVDREKDQTYGLSFLEQAQLRKIVFPLGGMRKSEVYGLAQREGFEIFSKRKQSQDLCFVSGNALPEYIEGELGKKKGEIVDESGTVVGRHEGLHFYTIGQRKGLRLPHRYYVKAFDVLKNLLVVTEDRKKLLGKEARLTDVRLISGEVPKKKFSAMAQVRYRQKAERAVVEVLRGKKAVVKFAKPVEAITPGQVCALYRGSECIGAGIIS